MALLWANGFDSIDGTGIDNLFKPYYHSSLGYTTGRTSGLALYPASNTGYFGTKVLPAEVTTIICGFAFYTGVAASSFTTSHKCFRILDGSLNEQISITPKAVGHGYSWAVLNGAGAELGVGTDIFMLLRWHYVEVKVVLSDTVGTVEVRVDGNVVVSLTGQDTDYQNTGGYKAVRFNGADCYPAFDDVYICDASGSINNDFLGDVVIRSLVPTADGFYTDFTPSTGSDHYAMVDGVFANTADNIDSITVGHRDSFTLAAAPSRTIKGLCLHAYGDNNDAGTRDIKLFSRVASTDYDGDLTHTLTAGDLAYHQVIEQNPATSSAWTAATIASAEFGVKVES